MDVSYNRQYKKFFKRVAEQALVEGRARETTSRKGLINMHSLIHNQFQSLVYRDMLRYAWRGTDRSYTSAELDQGRSPPRMVQDIQFDFDKGLRREHQPCNNYAFLRGSNCGKVMCLHQFLARSCFHDQIAGPSGVSPPNRRPTTPAYDDYDEL